MVTLPAAAHVARYEGDACIIEVDDPAWRGELGADVQLFAKPRSDHTTDIARGRVIGERTIRVEHPWGSRGRAVWVRR